MTSRRPSPAAMTPPAPGRHAPGGGAGLRRQQPERKVHLDIWCCAECGCERKATAHQRRKTYCSRPCMAAAFSRRLVGEANPNHKAAGHHECKRCGVAFQSYSKTRKYCSQECAKASLRRLEPIACAQCRSVFRPKVNFQRFCGHDCATAATRKERPPKRIRVPFFRDCRQCEQPFRTQQSSTKKFCSYECHLASGGAQKAGRAAVMARRAYGAKKDANHDEIFNTLRRFVAVKDLSGAGFGVPDGLAWIKGGWQLFDVKNPKSAYGKKGLNPIQKKWAQNWLGGPVYLIHSEQEALLFVQGKFDELKSFGGGTIVTAEHLKAWRDAE